MSQFNGLEAVTLRTQRGCTATVLTYAAHLVSWKNAEGQDYLFCSPNAVFQPPKAIRGGVPICFPQFSNFGRLGQHGFARNKQFQVVEQNEWSVTMALEYDGTEFPDYPHPFRLTSRVALCEDDLEQHVSVTNTGTSAMPFTAALHTYYAVSDITNVTVTGFKGLQYLDSADGRLEKAEGGEAVTFDGGEVDRIYVGAPDELTIHDRGANRTFVLRKTGLPDAVLWSPGPAKAASMSDLGEVAWRGMVCLEPGLVVSSPVELGPGDTWTGSQAIRVSHGSAEGSGGAAAL